MNDPKELRTRMIRAVADAITRRAEQLGRDPAPADKLIETFEADCAAYCNGQGG